MRTALAANAIKNVFDPIPCKRQWIRVCAVFVLSCNPYTSETCPYSVNGEEFIHIPLLKNFILFSITRNDGPWNLSIKCCMWITARLKVVHFGWVGLAVQITGTSQMSVKKVSSGVCSLSLWACFGGKLLLLLRLPAQTCFWDPHAPPASRRELGGVDNRYFLKREDFRPAKRASITSITVSYQVCLLHPLCRLRRVVNLFLWPVCI